VQQGKKKLIKQNFLLNEVTNVFQEDI